MVDGIVVTLQNLTRDHGQMYAALPSFTAQFSHFDNWNRIFQFYREEWMWQKALCQYKSLGTGTIHIYTVQTFWWMFGWCTRKDSANICHACDANAVREKIHEWKNLYALSAHSCLYCWFLMIDDCREWLISIYSSWRFHSYDYEMVRQYFREFSN